MKNEAIPPDLLKKIKVQYELLEKIPLSIKFYEAYAEYRNLADEIEIISKIDSSTKIEPIPDGGIFDSFFGYITYRVYPTISLLQERKKDIFKKLPENDEEWFKNLQYTFLQLAKMQGDTRLSYWFGKTEKLLNDFLDQVVTTEAGNKLFLETNIMNVMHEIFDLLQAHKRREELQRTPLESIHQNDIHTIVMYYKKMNEGQKNNSSEAAFSLRSRGEIGTMNIYSEQKKTKDEMMLPVHIFQSKLPEIAQKEKTGGRNKGTSYITKDGDDFFHKGKLLNRLDKGAEYYKVFSALYSLLPEGGEVMYSDLIKEISRTLPKIKDQPSDEQITYIQKKLTERGNGFQKYAELLPLEDNQKPLIKARRGFGIVFNNQKG